MYLIQKNNKYLIIPFITAILSWIIWNKYKDTHIETIVEESMSNQLDDLQEDLHLYSV